MGLLMWDSANHEHQGELAHRNPKSAYLRTSRKFYVKQITQIERRQARLHRLRAKLDPLEADEYENPGEAKSPVAHHFIGASQNIYDHIGTFLRANADDPAVKVSH